MGWLATLLALLALAGAAAPAQAAGEYVFDSQWGEEGIDPGQLAYPNDIAVDHQGHVWVVTNYWIVHKFSAAGAFAFRLSLANDSHSIVALAVDPSNNVYLADSYNARIRKFDTSGSELPFAAGGVGTGDGRFNNISDITVDRDGFVYAADSGNTRIQKFTATGGFVTKFSTGTGTANLAIDVDDAGNVYAIDDTCNSVVVTGCKVHKFASNGTLQGEWGGYDATPPTAGMFRTPWRIAVDGAGNQFVTDNAFMDSQYARVQKLSPAGAFATQISKEGVGDGEYSSPSGIAVDDRGNVWVADYGAHRVMKYRPASADATAPVLTLPGKLTHEAVGATGVAVSYTVTANDAIDGPVTASCSPAPGSIFAIGTTLVTCTASDAAGNRASASFEIVVTHLLGPVLSLPLSFTAQSTSAAGASVAYTVSAIDAVDGAVTVSCAPESGSTFPIGSTTVRCSAKDRTGNAGSGTFSVTIKAPSAPAPDLGKRVIAAGLSGTVTIKSPASKRFTTLAPNGAVAVGSTIDASKGRVRITIAQPKGGPWQAEIWGGLARVSQNKAGAVEAILAGEKPSCTRRKPKSRKLWLSTSGPLRTRGLYANATPARGKLASWLTEDRCRATYVRVTKGAASVKDTARTKAVSVTVKAGHSYLARKR